MIEAAEEAGLAPGTFVRRAAAKAAAEDLRLDGGALTPELAEPVKQPFRGVRLLTFLKREELDASGKGTRFDRAAEDARTAQFRALATEDSGEGR